MRLTSFTDFALRALMRLAGEPNRSFTTDEIATEFAISRHHLTKVVRNLAQSGFIVTRRGTGGGFRLARPPQAITLGEVIRTFEQHHPPGRVLPGGWRKLCADAALPTEPAAGRSAGGLFEGTRRDHACIMRLPRNGRATLNRAPAM
jgi:Rrf2 family protein